MYERWQRILRIPFRACPIFNEVVEIANPLRRNNRQPGCSGFKYGQWTWIEVAGNDEYVTRCIEFGDVRNKASRLEVPLQFAWRETLCVLPPHQEENVLSAG